MLRDEYEWPLQKYIPLTFFIRMQKGRSKAAFTKKGKVKGGGVKLK